MALTFTACDSDDDMPTPPVTQVSNGVYLVGDATNADAVADFRLSSASIDQFPDIGSRTGLTEAYAYLAAGSFNVVEYIDEVATSYGGALAEADFSADYKMMVGDVTVDGAAITIAEAGLHHVTFDKSTGKLVVVPIKVWGVIGNATPNGWAEDTEINLVSATADEVVFQGTDIAMKEGEFKVRYNKNWSLDLSADVPDLKLFTNFGGSLSSLIAGGANIPFAAADQGLYTVTATYTPGAGNSIAVTVERTGDIPVNTYDPSDYPWALIGAATTTGWGSDTAIPYFDWSGNWVMAHTLTEDVFKYRVGEWVNELNPGNATLDNESTIGDSGDGNFTCTEAGAYFTSIRTDDDGASWNLKVKKLTPEVIGNATPNANFDEGIPLTFVGEDAGTYTWEITGAAMTADIFKFRMNGQWELQANPANSTIEGTNAGEISTDGDNMRLGTAGTYSLKVATSDLGATWTVTID